MGRTTEPRLSDLRKWRAPLEFKGIDDGEPYEFEVWIVKVNDDDIQTCWKAAGAAKVRYLVERKDPDSDLCQDTYHQTLDLGDEPETLIEWLSMYHMADNELLIRAEVAGGEDSEWAKDDYYTSLLAAWLGDPDNPDDLGLQLAYQAKDDDPESLDPAVAVLVPEAIRVYDEMERFELECTTKLEAERQRFMRDLDGEDIEALRKKVVDQHLEEQELKVWNNAFERAQIYYCTRRFDNHRKRYFDSPAEVADVDKEFRQKILDTYKDMSTGTIEGKDSPGPQSSSPESGSSDAEETSEASGPMVATG